jgi:hypothetical protein
LPSCPGRFSDFVSFFYLGTFGVGRISLRRNISILDDLPKGARKSVT